MSVKVKWKCFQDFKNVENEVRDILCFSYGDILVTSIFSLSDSLTAFTPTFLTQVWIG